MASVDAFGLSAVATRSNIEESAGVASMDGHVRFAVSFYGVVAASTYDHSAGQQQRLALAPSAAQCYSSLAASAALEFMRS
jgi:hypothetical protein